MKQNMPIVLASQSPRRKELLQLMRCEFTSLSAHTEETFHPERSLQDNIMRIAEEKARSVIDAYPEQTSGAIVIGADTTVVLDTTPLRKPSNYTEACRMLGTLQGNTHQVMTGFALVSGASSYTECVTTTVEIAPMTKNEIAEYVSTQNPYDKAGSYGIQDPVLSCFVTSISGCYYNVVGLPVAAVYRALQNMTGSGIFT
ncbi:MAG TPA: septum formation protein Maf [Prosthecochloris aestuarii]|uniref:dTTP/UTP pyrophosphatase n=1 Tax=Prosthecochloris aestuarii TaxID=1102 RepID=A0A831WS44_PROAE|nr:septum formation protein Maf [Prosthecochloris aestuarii]